MTSPLNMVALAAGDVRVSIDELSVSGRLQLLQMYAKILKNHYGHGQKGGAGFRTWHWNSLGDPITPYSVRQYFVQNMDVGLHPNETDYTPLTRIAALSSDGVRLPEFKKPQADWDVGDIQLITRFCLTNVGDLYLEWYEGEVTKMDEKYWGRPKCVTITSAEYHKVPLADGHALSPAEKKAIGRINTVLEKTPGKMYLLVMSMLRIVAEETLQKEKSAARSRDLLNELNTKGYIFRLTRS